MDIFNYIVFPMLLVALGLAWHSDTGRWFIFTVLIVELIDELTIPMSMQWKLNYYLWGVFMNVLFFIPIIYRKRIAIKLHNLTGLNYFQRVWESHRFTVPEGALMCVFSLSLLVNLITYIEVLMYKYYVIDTALFKLYIRDNVQLVLHFLTGFAALTFAQRHKHQETVND